MIFFAFIAQLLNLWPLFLIATGVLLALSYQNGRKARHALSEERVLLLLEIPRTNDKKELSAEQMFASLHGILRSRKELMREGSLQEHLSFEIAAIGKRIRFYVSVPKHLQNFVEGQIYAQYPTVQIFELAEDYADRDFQQTVVHGAELTLIDNEVLPIKTFPNFEVDPLAAITATLAKLEDDEEEIWIQILARPISDNWHKRSARFVERVKGKSGGAGGSVGSMLAQLLAAPFKVPEPSDGKAKAPEISERDRSRVSAAEEKSVKLGYQVKIRLIYLGNSQATAKLRMQAMVGTFKQFNSTNLNGFKQVNSGFQTHKLLEYRARHFVDHGRILNIEELASVFHLPHTSVETPNIVWASAKTAEPPSNLPAMGSLPQEEISLFGLTNFRGTNLQFGIRRSDRGRHLYIIGQTGSGKSGLLQLLTLSDIFHNQGFAVIDPHGDYALGTLGYIPAYRMQDVVYFNPADTEFPIGFNPLEVTDPAMKTHISSELVGVLKRMFESWGPRLEYILRYTILALLDYPGSTMLDITRMLTEKDFRNEVISHVTDPVVRNFWTVEFASWNDKFAAEAVAPVLNKVGAFTANPMIRNIVGQQKSTINLREVMDSGKILIVNLSRGLVGEDNAAILGSLIVTKLQLAAMSRADIRNIEDRRPFYLYVDEFQNFATDSFAVILSEARKYGLNLTVANQYVSQMPPVVKDAVFGNVGSMISFRVGADDAAALQRYFEPQFESQDLIQLHNRDFVASMSIGGEKTPAFSARTLNWPPQQEDHSAAMIQHSRALYSRPRAEVEQAIIAASYTAKQLPAAKDHRLPAKAQGGNNGGNNQQNDQQRSKKNKQRNNTNDRGNRNQERPKGRGEAKERQSNNRSERNRQEKPRDSGNLQSGESVKLR